jgi:REP element-mobilizing transposase RayT
MSKMEGGAPATPKRSDATPENQRARRSSPLHREGRKTPAHFATVESGFRSKIIFLTVCTDRRKPLLANKETAERIINAWQAADFWRVGRYVIMPNHIHLFCAPGTLVPTRLKDWISFWKKHVTRAWSVREELPLWQRDYWDTQLRRRESYSAKWEYVRNNPVRHGYVSRAEDWPYQGELNILEWHDR